MEQNKKIIANAVSAYFMIFISLAFLFQKKNTYLNNSFVKSHTKTAFIIHMMFLITYVVFVSFGLGKEFSVLWYWVNTILASVIFIGLLAMLLYGIYRANKWEVLTADELLTLSRQDALVEVEKKNFSEQEKVSIILSYIPFLGYIVYGQNYTNQVLKNINKIALIAGIFITLLFVFSSYNLGLLFSLAYIVFVVFSCTVLISKDELIKINIDKIPTPEDKIVIQQSLLSYLWKYFWKKDFIELKKIIETKKQERILAEKKDTEIFWKLTDVSLPKKLIYIPFLVLIYIPQLKSKQNLHIKNSLWITLWIMLSWCVFGIDSSVQAFALFPIAYWVWFIDRIWYKMPYAYEAYEIIFEKILWKIFWVFKKWEKLHKTEKREKLIAKAPTKTSEK